MQFEPTKNYFVFKIAPDKYFDDGDPDCRLKMKLTEMKEGREITWKANIAGATKGDILFIKCTKDQRECIKKNPSKEIKEGICFIAEILDVDEENKLISFRILENLIDNPINDKQIFILKGFGGRNRGLSKIEDTNKLLTLLQKHLSIDEYSPTIIEDLSTLQPPLNQILYGPPGTGKTYAVIERALKIIARKENIEIDWNNREKVKEKFKEYQKKEQIAFVTFHQSYSYEEFIEGIKPCDLDSGCNENNNIQYKIEDGIFKTISKCAISSSNFDEVYDKFIEKIGNKQLELKTKTGKPFKIKVNSRGNLTLLTGKNFNPIGTITKERLKKQSFKGCYSYCEPILEELKQRFGLKEVDNSSKNFILIIDEINRANISKVFGELITLIEADKRLLADEELTVTLPYSKEEFGVPQNLYIIGTMNTADRSIALLDTALRRRFHFEELMPDPTKLPENLNGINLQEMLMAINTRIEYLLDRDHTIGHAYFLNVQSLDDLKDLFRYKIIPLLAEYFYDDWENIQKVLNNNRMIIEKQTNDKYLKNIEQSGKKIFEISDPEHWDEETFKAIYEEKNEDPNQ